MNADCSAPEEQRWFYISEIGGDAVLGTAYAFWGDSLFSDELLYIITFRSVFVKRFNAF